MAFQRAEEAAGRSNHQVLTLGQFVEVFVLVPSVGGVRVGEGAAGGTGQSGIFFVHLRLLNRYLCKEMIKK